MNLVRSAKGYFSDARQDLATIGRASTAPISRRAFVVGIIFMIVLALVMNITVVFAANTDLFSTLSSAVSDLRADAEDMVNNVAIFALVICILGIFIASMFGPKATATMTTALKMVIGFFIFWQLVPVIISTLESLFGNGASSSNP